MADNKHISIRIKDKYDSITNWLTKWDSFVPLEGEVCVIHIPTGTSEANLSSIGVSNKITNLPVDLIKVGDGTSNIGALPFTTSGSADKLATPRTIKLKGDVTGSGSFDGSANLEITATVADNSHTHSISNVTDLQTTLESKAPIEHGTHVTYSTTLPVVDGTASVGTATEVARSDHKHPTDTTRAQKNHASTGTTYGVSTSSKYGHAMASNTTPKEDADTASVGEETSKFARGDHAHPHDSTKVDVTAFDAHKVNSTHISDDERTKWNTAHTHSQSTHARTDATKVEDSTTNGNIKINGTETNVYSHPNSGVSAGTYKSVTVNEQGHVTGGSNPTTLAGFGITDGEAKGTASSTVSTHNTSTSAHNDIRDLITGLTTRLNTLANSDDTTLDQMSEIVAYIKNNKSLIDGITTSKVNVSDIVDNLTTNVTNKPLSASQGVAIKALIDGLQLSLNTHDSNTTKHITSTERTNWNVAKTHADSAHAPSNAQPNQNAFSNVAVSGQTTVSADTTTDTLTLAAGDNVTITTDATNDKITIASQDTNTTYDLAATKSSTNGNTKLNLTAGGSGSGTDSVTIKGTGGTTVTTDANGVVTVNSTHNSHAIISGAKADGTTNIQGSASSGNITLGDSGVTAGEYGPTANATPGYGSTFNVPDIKVNSKGIVTSIVNRTVKIPASDNTNQTVKVGTTTFGANDAVSITAGSNVTVTPDATNKKITIASSHPTVTKETNTTSTESPAHGETFTAVDGVTTDGNGHVTKINTKTVTLPTDTKVTQTSTTVNAKHPLMLTANASPSSGGAGTSIYNTNIYANPSTGTIGAKRIERNGIELTRIFGSMIPYGTSIPASADLNTTAYIKVGNYFNSKNVDVATMTNCPTTSAFMMQVFSPLSTTIDNEASGTWVYRIRKIIDYRGDEWWQYVDSGATAGSFTYGAWKKILKSTDVATVATSGNYSDLSGKPTIPTVNNGTLTIQKNGTDVTTFTANSASNVVADITVPTKVSDLNNDSGFVTDDHTHKYAGSSSAGGAATSAKKVEKSLTVQLNGGSTEGTNKFTFDGSTAKSMDITPANIGAATSGHTHTTTITTDTGTNELTLEHGKKYALTAGGDKFIFTMPTDSNSHYQAKNIVGTSTTATTNGAVTGTGGVYLNLIEDGSVRSTHKIVGSGATTVKSDSSGNITIATADGSTSAKGVVQLSDAVNSTSTALAATANAVKQAYDKANHSHNYLPTAGGNVSGHVYLTGSQENSSTGNSSQIVFGTSSNNHVVISSNKNALVLNPTTSTTTNQIIMYLDKDKQSQFPSGITSSGTVSARTISASTDINFPSSLVLILDGGTSTDNIDDVTV